MVQPLTRKWLSVVGFVVVVVVTTVVAKEDLNIETLSNSGSAIYYFKLDLNFGGIALLHSERSRRDKGAPSDRLSNHSVLHGEIYVASASVRDPIRNELLKRVKQDRPSHIGRDRGREARFE